ncbi:MAG: hypothetical protein M3Y59_06390 [Myxococcota bacterium]|nr:hypothetical protein [Myxococcota bacterium]
MVALDPAIHGDIPERLRTAFGQALLAEIRKMEAVSALSSSEIREIVSVERQRQLLGCGEDTDTCMAELAGALDVSESLAGELSLVGTKYTLSLRRINLLGAQVTSKTRTFEKRDGEELLAVVGPMVQELFPERPLLPGKKRGVSAEVVRRLNPPPLPKWAFFTAAGASAVAGVAGGTFGLLSGQAAQQHNALAQTALTSPVSGEQLAALRQQATSNAQLANAAFIGAGVLAVGAAVQFFFTDWQPESSAPTVALLPTGNGAALVGTF